MEREIALLLILAAGAGMIATLAILRRRRHEAESGAMESPFAVSTEGEKRCPRCGMGNLVTSGICVSCGEKLAG